MPRVKEKLKKLAPSTNTSCGCRKKMQKSSRLHYIVNSKAFAQQKNLELIIKNNDV